MEKAKHNLKIQQWVLLVAVALFAIKLLAYFYTHAVTILSDALESVVNIIAAIITMYSLYVAAKPTDEDHPYGHGKAEFVAANIEGILIFIAAIVIIVKAIMQIIEPSPLTAVAKGTWMIAFTAVVNWIMGAICIRTGKKNNSLALIASGKHLQTDTFSTFAVVLSLLLVYITQWELLDSLVSLALGIFIGYTGFKIIRSSLAGIMDEADQTILKEIIDHVNTARHDDWIDLHNLRVIKYGGQYHIDCHLTVPWYYTVKEAHEEIDLLTKTIREATDQPVEMMVHSDDCKPASCNICSKSDCHVRQHPFERKIEWNLKTVTTNSRHSLKKTDVSG